MLCNESSRRCVVRPVVLHHESEAQRDARYPDAGNPKASEVRARDDKPDSRSARASAAGASTRTSRDLGVFWHGADASRGTNSTLGRGGAEGAALATDCRRDRPRVGRRGDDVGHCSLHASRTSLYGDDIWLAGRVHFCLRNGGLGVVKIEDDVHAAQYGIPQSQELGVGALLFRLDEERTRVVLAIVRDRLLGRAVHDWHDEFAGVDVDRHGPGKFERERVSRIGVLAGAYSVAIHVVECWRDELVVVVLRNRPCCAAGVEEHRQRRIVLSVCSNTRGAAGPKVSGLTSGRDIGRRDSRDKLIDDVWVLPAIEAGNEVNGYEIARVFGAVDAAKQDRARSGSCAR